MFQAKFKTFQFKVFLTENPQTKWTNTLGGSERALALDKPVHPQRAAQLPVTNQDDKAHFCRKRKTWTHVVNAVGYV